MGIGQKMHEAIMRKFGRGKGPNKGYRGMNKNQARLLSEMDIEDAGGKVKMKKKKKGYKRKNKMNVQKTYDAGM